MGLEAVIGTVIALAPGVAAARPIAVELDGPATFDAGELETALAVRLPGAGAPVRVQITPTPGGVVVVIDGAVRTVELGDRRGAEAARLVALAATDLVLDDLAVAPRIDAGPSVAATARPRGAPRAPRLTVGVLGGAAPGWDGTLASVTVDLALGRGAWIATLDVGGMTLVGGPVELTGALIRGGPGYRTGAAELRAGLVVAPISVSDGAGDRTALVGAGASARTRLAFGGGIAGVVAAGVDLLATRTEYRDAGVVIATTPWWSPWLSLGIEVAP